MKKDGILDVITEEKTWWQKRSKTQKAVIVSGSIVAVLTTIFLVYRSTKKVG
jgi:flagellar biosynthesis/type III secretory pathway M-ring protein FliF/YscJ